MLLPLVQCVCASSLERRSRSSERRTTNARFFLLLRMLPQPLAAKLAHLMRVTQVKRAQNCFSLSFFPSLTLRVREAEQDWTLWSSSSTSSVFNAKRSLEANQLVVAPAFAPASCTNQTLLLVQLRVRYTHTHNEREKTAKKEKFAAKHTQSLICKIEAEFKLRRRVSCSSSCLVGKFLPLDVELTAAAMLCVLIVQAKRVEFVLRAK